MLEGLIAGLRNVARRPAVTVAIVGPLAMATAVNAALFAITDGLLFRPLPLAHAERTVVVSAPQQPRLGPLVDILVDPSLAGDYVRAFRSSPLFSKTIASAPGGAFSTKIVWETSLRASAVEVGFFEHFGLAPALGRVFSEDDQALTDAREATSDRPLPVIISDGYWTSQLGRDAGVVDATTTIAERRVIVIGVMQPGVKFPRNTDVWTPRGRGPMNQLRGFAHLAPGTSLEQVRAAFPLLDFVPLREHLRPDGAGALLFIFAAALSLLLLAWIQVGGPILTSTSDRLREIGIRLTLGAGRRRIVGQFAAEAFWLICLGLALSLPLTPPTTTALVQLLPDQLTGAHYLQADRRTLVFALATALVGFAVLTTSPLGLVQIATRRTHGDHTGAAPATRSRVALLTGQVAWSSATLRCHQPGEPKQPMTFSRSMDEW
jgi:hypothetical protein